MFVFATVGSLCTALSCVAAYCSVVCVNLRSLSLSVTSSSSEKFTRIHLKLTRIRLCIGHAHSAHFHRIMFSSKRYLEALPGSDCTRFRGSKLFMTYGTIGERHCRITITLFSERELAIWCRPSVCLSVTLVHPTQPVEIVGNVSTPFGTLTISWYPRKILRRSSQGNPSVGG